MQIVKATLQVVKATMQAVAVPEAAANGDKSRVRTCQDGVLAPCARQAALLLDRLVHRDATLCKEWRS